MNSKKLTFTILAAASILLLCVFCAFFSKGQKTAYAAAEGANITQSGVDFINAAPEETTVYKAGEGSVTYIPAQTDGTAEIVLENAEIHSGTKVNYLPPHWAYAAVAATGDVKLILKGDNRVYLRSQSNNNPLLFYDSNVVVSGDGTLTIDRENASDKNRNVIPFHVRSDNDLSGNEEEYAKSGNFVLESGTISLNAGSASGEGCLMVINNVKILGGKIQTYGQAYGIYSVNGDVEISGGNVRAEEFRSSGVYAKRGDIKVGGDAKLYVSSYKNSSTSGIFDFRHQGGEQRRKRRQRLFLWRRNGSFGAEHRRLGAGRQFCGCRQDRDFGRQAARKSFRRERKRCGSGLCTGRTSGRRSNGRRSRSLCGRQRRYALDRDLFPAQ